jgi:hypothetical protein
MHSFLIAVLLKNNKTEATLDRPNKEGVTYSVVKSARDRRLDESRGEANLSRYYMQFTTIL